MRLTILFLFIVSSAFAQKTIYTITKTDKTEYKAKSYSDKFKKLRITTIDNKKIDIPYNQLEKIKFVEKKKRRSKPKNVTLKFIRISKRNGVLMKVLKEGNCDLYVHEFQYKHYYVLRNEEQIATPIYLKQILSNNFKKTALNYFKDCRKLTEKIKTKEFTKKNISKMVDYYNSTCEK